VARMLEFMLSGGTVRTKLGDLAHGVVWAARLRQGHYDSPDLIPEIALFNEIDLANRVALDIGAHAGSWSQVLARKVSPAGVVLAYEAFPHYGRALSIALRIAGVRNVRVRNVAVGASDGEVILRWQAEGGDFLGGRTHIDPKAKISSGAVPVKMVSIDQDLSAQGLQAEDVAFVKIDVEGAELEVLRGASNLLSIGRPPVFLEAEPQWNFSMGHSVQDVFTAMANYGYAPHLVSEGGIKPTDIDAYLAQYASHKAAGRSSVCHNNVLFLPMATRSPQ